MSKWYASRKPTQAENDEITLLDWEKVRIVTEVEGPKTAAAVKSALQNGDEDEYPDGKYDIFQLKNPDDQQVNLTTDAEPVTIRRKK